MTSSPKPPTPEKSNLLLDFPIRLYTALRTIRLYPATNPQVQRGNDLMLHAFQALRAIDSGDGSVTLAFSDGKVFVCGEQLPERDQARPQIQGLLALANRFNLHSFTFHPSFSAVQCAAFVQAVSVLLGDWDVAEPITALLEKAGITTVSIDVKRYVAIHGGEQVVHEEALNSELDISDEELADLVLAKNDQKTLPGVSTELVQELISRLPPPGTPYQHPEEVTKGVIDFLHKLSKETDRHQQTAEIEQSAKALSGLDPSLLARLLATLPPTPDADSILRSALHQLTSRQMDALIVNLVAQLAATGDADARQSIADTGNPLNRLVKLEQENTPEIQQTITRNIDARQLLLNPDTTLAQLPEYLLERLRQPEWSASVLATAAAQHTDEPHRQAMGQVDLQAFNRLLERYEQLLGSELQAMVARQAGAQLASMEGLALGNILAQRFKGLFGEQLYNQVVSQVSSEILDETVDQLTPAQLNRMIAALTSGIPFAKGDISEFNIAGDALFSRLASTSKGPELTQTIARNIDARQLLLNPDTTLSELPEYLLKRLRQPEWSASVLATAAQQVADPQLQTAGQVDFQAFSRLLERYEELHGHEQQAVVARQAGTQLASMEGLALGNILAQRFKGLFGEQLYNQVVTQVSDKILDETVGQLTPAQLNRMIAALTSGIPLVKGDTSEFNIAGDALFSRLANTKKGAEITQTIARNIDARQLLVNRDTALSELPEHLLKRLRQPEWSASVLAAAAQQVADPQLRAAGQVDFQAFNHVLERYEELYTGGQQTVIARHAGAQLASMEGLALGNILAQRFKGLFGEQLYRQVVAQVADETLDKTVSQLTPGQLNQMIASLIHGVPVGKEGRTEFKIADGELFKRLAKTKKGPEITQTAARNIDARRLLLNSGAPLNELPEHLLQRLRQPEWSASVLMAAAQHAVDTVKASGNLKALDSFERTLAATCDNLFDQEKQEQVAIRAAADFSSFDEQELGLILVRTYKSLFGERLYRQVIRQLSEDKLGRLVNHFRELCDSGDDASEESFKLLQETVRREKRRVIIEMYRQQKRQREEQQQTSLKKRLDDLIQGDLAALTQIDVQHALPTEVCDLLADGQEKAADIFLTQLVAALHHELPAIRTAAFHCLAATGERLIPIGQWERIEKLLPALQQGIRLNGIGEQAVQQAMTAIGGLAGHYFAEERYPQAGGIVQILGSFSNQDASAESTNRLVRNQALATLKYLCSRSTLEKLMHLYLHSETQQEVAGSLLIAMGSEAAKFQLQQLIANESRFERKRILALITQTGNPAISILREQLHKDQPWFVVRNVIRLLGEIGTPDVFAAIIPYVAHPDLRVQQEVISSASKIGGDDFKEFLLQALHTVDDSLKIKVVNHIATNHDERFVRPLTDLLESSQPFPGKNKNDLQLALCKTLGTIGSRRAAAPLTRVVQSKNVLGLGGYADEVREAAARALKQIQTSSADRKSDEKEGNALGAATESIQPAAAEKNSLPVEAREEAIFHLAAQGDKEQAKQQLFDLIVATARTGDFKNAERLRERIYEIDGLALDEIIRSGEIIEEEKMEAIKEEDLEIWSDLTDRLTALEFQTVYHELSELRFAPEETVVNQGDKNDALFLITQGSLKVSHQTGSRELFITTLNRGQIAGENFFAPSFWTVTLTSLTPTRLHVLKQSTLDAWKEQFPGLRAKLHAYYLACNTIGSMLEKKGLERRQDQRFILARKIQVQPVSSRDTPIGHGFRAETADISHGGLAFLVRISRQENARLLLGRRMQIVLPVGGKQQPLTFKGIIIGIQPFQILENDFSVHFKFDLPLDQQQLQSILG